MGSQVKPILIVLNGTSSAGKTTLATALRARCSTPLQVSGVDTFLALQPESMFAPPGSQTPTEGFTFCATLGPPMACRSLLFFVMPYSPVVRESA